MKVFDLKQKKIIAKKKSSLFNKNASHCPNFNILVILDWNFDSLVQILQVHVLEKSSQDLF